jgi:hypothetical protein
MPRRPRVTGAATGTKGRLGRVRRRSGTPEARLAYSPGLDGLRVLAVFGNPPLRVFLRDTSLQLGDALF